jgi:hypothetical protein
MWASSNSFPISRILEIYQKASNGTQSNGIKDKAGKDISEAPTEQRHG